MLFVNQKLNQLLELDYNDMPENPLDMVDGVQFFIGGDVREDLIDTIFDGDEEAYQAEHDKHTNTNGLFNGLAYIAQKQGKLVLPITKYEHSQVRYYLGVDQDWDCSVIGFVVVDMEKFKSYYGVNSNSEIESYLNDWLDEYTDYANGEIYLATVYQLNSEHEIDGEIDCIDNLFPKEANVASLLDIGLMDGDLKDWKKATKKITTSYVSAE